MMATLLGAAVSDGLDNGQVVSGVAASIISWRQAFALHGARSILALEAARQAGASAQSNIRWSYAHETIPRHLRDIIVTEYGVADLRGKSDADVIAAMLQVADSRFQDELARAAKDAGKLPKSYEIPASHRENAPERIAAALKPAREAGLLPSFPFGSDFTEPSSADPGTADTAASATHAARSRGLLWRGLTRTPDAADKECLARLDSTALKVFPSASTTHWSVRRWREAGRLNCLRVPANAGTHNHRQMWLRGAVAPAFKKINSGDYGPCVRRGDGKWCKTRATVLFAGLRFSMNAAMPSARSSRANVEWNRLRSTFSPSASCVSKARLMASLAIAAAGRDIAAIFSAAAITSSINLSAARYG